MNIYLNKRNSSSFISLSENICKYVQLIQRLVWFIETTGPGCDQYTHIKVDSKCVFIDNQVYEIWSLKWPPTDQKKIYTNENFQEQVQHCQKLKMFHSQAYIYMQLELKGILMHVGCSEVISLFRMCWAEIHQRLLTQNHKRSVYECLEKFKSGWRTTDKQIQQAQEVVLASYHWWGRMSFAD